MFQRETTTMLSFDPTLDSALSITFYLASNVFFFYGKYIENISNWKKYICIFEQVWMILEEDVYIPNDMSIFAFPCELVKNKLYIAKVKR